MERLPSSNPESEQSLTPQEALAVIESLRSVFDEQFANGNLDEALQTKQALETRMRALQERVNPLKIEGIEDLPKQYERQKELLLQSGLIETIGTNDLGIKAIDGKEYPFPNRQELGKLIRENKELFQQKAEQGFKRMLIVPRGLPLSKLIETYKQTLLAKHQAGQLFQTTNGTPEPINLNMEEPVWVWDKLIDADINGTLVYEPKEYKPEPENHQGKTKQQILEENGGFEVLLIEDNLTLPREGTNETINGRKRLEAHQSPEQYLKTLKTESQYLGEQGLIPEAWLTLALQRLQETDTVLDDYGNDKDSACYNLSAYLPSSGGVPLFYWFRSDRGVYLNGDHSRDRVPDIGVRSAVRIKA